MSPTPIDDTLLRGAIGLEQTPAGVRPYRLLERARRQASDGQIAMAEAQPSGVRLAFRTDATRIRVRARATRYRYRGAPERPHGVFDLRVNGALASSKSLEHATVITIDITTGQIDVATNAPDLVTFEELPSGSKEVEIWLPHNEAIELIALETNAPVAPLRSDAPRWVHHGSSISQGSNALHPTETWPAVAAAQSGAELTNLGFSGSALLDPFVARQISEHPAELISVKIGINLVNTDLMRQRAFRPAVHGFLDVIRDGHPTTPLLVISPLFCPIHERTPGPVAFDPDALAKGETRFIATGDPRDAATGKLTLEIIRAELERIVREREVDDRQLQYLDGRDLYGQADSTLHPLADALHPDAATHAVIGQRFADHWLDEWTRKTTVDSTLHRRREERPIKETRG